MDAASLALLAFLLLNAVRIAAYLPQVLRIVEDGKGARAVSMTTWLVFTGSHLATTAYAALTSDDLLLVIIFGLNSVGAGAVLAALLIERWRASEGGMRLPTAARLGRCRLLSRFVA